MKKVLIFSFLAILIPSLSYSETRSFDFPKIDGIHVDWCLTWSRDCGQAAADNFCRYQKYRHAADYRKAEDIGYTKILQTGEICRQPFCDGFAYIVCEGNMSKTFDFPEIKTQKGQVYRLDWCRTWGRDCGRGAADTYCRNNGYSTAKSWEIDPDIGNNYTTFIIGTGELCEENFCDGFRFIECE